MSEHTYDTVYQCSIEEYAKAHGTSVKKLIKKAQKDIEIMINGKLAIFQSVNEGDLSDEQIYTVQTINEALRKKEAHVKRLNAWIKKQKEKK